MTSIQVKCPKCGHELLVVIEYEGNPPSIALCFHCLSNIPIPKDSKGKDKERKKTSKAR